MLPEIYLYCLYQQSHKLVQPYDSYKPIIAISLGINTFWAAL